MKATISFAVRPHYADGPLVFVPVVDDVDLTDRVATFEREHEMDHAGGYGGLIPEFYRCGPAASHYFETSGMFTGKDGKVPLLGCHCGEWGCWPLNARVIVEPATVTWLDFEQPHRRVGTTRLSARSSSVARTTSVQSKRSPRCGQG